jgi:hypothetical protein
VSSLCDCIVLALLERDLKERVAYSCVPHAFLVSLLFGYNIMLCINVNNLLSICDLVFLLNHLNLVDF